MPSEAPVGATARVGWLCCVLSVPAVGDGARADHDPQRLLRRVARALQGHQPGLRRRLEGQDRRDIAVNQSHGGSSKQALSVVAGLDADVVTMNQAPDIDFLVEHGGWCRGLAQALPARRDALHHDHGVPGAQGQSQGHQGLGRPGQAGVQVIVPNPKTSGNGRYTYLAAWGYALTRPRARRQRATS